MGVGDGEGVIVMGVTVVKGNSDEVEVVGMG